MTSDNKDYNGCSDDMPRKKFEPIPAYKFANLESAGWLIKGVLPLSELVVIYGPSGCGKTFFTLNMVMSVALGEAWDKHKVTQGRCVYIAAEGATGFKKRIIAYANYNRIKLEELTSFDIIPDCPNLLNNTDAKSIADMIGEAKVVVMDTFSRVIPGGNENDGKDVGHAIQQCQFISKLTKALVILIHHTGKNVENGARGWSGLRAAVDTEISVEKLDNIHVATITKQKDGEEGERYGFTLDQVILGVDEDGDDITSCAYVKVDAPQKVKKDRPLGPWQQRVMDAFEVKYIPTHNAFPKYEEIIDDVVKSVVNSNPKRDFRRQRTIEAMNSLIDKKVLTKVGESIRRV